MKNLHGVGSPQEPTKRKNPAFTAAAKASAVLREAIGPYYEGLKNIESAGRLTGAFTKSFYRDEDRWLSPARSPASFANFLINEGQAPQSICHALRQLNLSKQKDWVSLTIEDVDLKVYGNQSTTHVQPILIAIPFPDMIYVPSKREYHSVMPDYKVVAFEPAEKPSWNLANHRNGQTTLEVALPFPTLPPNVSLFVLTGYLCHHYLGGEMFPLWRHSALQIEAVF